MESWCSAFSGIASERALTPSLSDECRCRGRFGGPGASPSVSVLLLSASCVVANASAAPEKTKPAAGRVARFGGDLLGDRWHACGWLMGRGWEAAGHLVSRGGLSVEECEVPLGVSDLGNCAPVTCPWLSGCTALLFRLHACSLAVLRVGDNGWTGGLRAGPPNRRTGGDVGEEASRELCGVCIFLWKLGDGPDDGFLLDCVVRRLPIPDCICPMEPCSRAEVRPALR